MYSKGMTTDELTTPGVSTDVPASAGADEGSPGWGMSLGVAGSWGTLNPLELAGPLLNLLIPTVSTEFLL